METFQVDLTNCNSEPIHIPGRVQSHGFLVAVNHESGLVSHISENIASFVADEAKNCLGDPLAELERKLAISGLPLTLDKMYVLAKNSKDGETINPLYLELDKKPFNLIVTRSANEQILEFEPQAFDPALDLQKTIGRSASRILAGKNLSALLQNAAQEIKKIIRYDRVMIYKFVEDGHGCVVSEAKNEDLEPFLGLHYPASDIPKQARELYKVNLTRIIADVHSESSPIITYNTQGDALDMTHSELRAVSPIHIQYLKNMGVASSFSISLIAHNELWGLVACHNYTPRFIDYKARDASKLIGQILSSALEYRQEEENVQASAAFNMAADELADHIEKEDKLVEALTGHSVTIKDIVSAAGVVLIFDRTINCIGSTPGEEEIKEIVQWLTLNMQDTIYFTHSFPEVFPPAKNYSQTASGIMACMLSKELGEWIIWFKPEQVETISWAGNPQKPVTVREDGLLTMSPRTSFHKWTEIVNNTSRKWSNGEAAIVGKIREQIINIINRKVNETRVLNERLKVAYEELDSFSYTISHDLRSPLSSIRNYSELLSLRNNNLDEQSRQIVERIIACTDKMDFLITKTLNYSKMGRTELEFRPIHMGNLLQEVKAEILNGLQPKDLEFSIGDTPSIKGDAMMINQVFTNLINNAVKYSARSKPAKVKVEGDIKGDLVVYTVSDNGIGIDTNYHSRVFELFRRMDNVEDFEGTGVGLAIVKRIVEKHNARIWFESELGIGTSFYVAFIN